VSDRSKYSSALPWFRIVLKQRDFASFGPLGIARKIERAGETAGPMSRWRATVTAQREGDVVTVAPSREVTAFGNFGCRGVV
jgi:hypothetical protein